MLSWDDAQTICQNAASDTSSASLTIFKQMMNTGYHSILAEFNRPNIEKTQTALTVASQQYYQMPSDTLFIKSITVTIDSVSYPLMEIEDQEYWDRYNSQGSTVTSDIPTYYFVRSGFGVNGTEIGIYPTPASANNTITVVYEAGDRDLSNNAYTTSTVTVVNGSATVTGSGTTFTAAMVGRYFRVTVDGTWYRISGFTSTTVITLENVFEGIGVAGAAYTISEAFALPEDMQILPCYYALAHYYDLKRDLNESIKYRALYDKELRAGKKRWGTKTRGAIVHGPGSRKTVLNPNFPPRSLS